MAKSDGKRVDVSRKDVYEIKVGDKQSLQLSEDEAADLLNGLQSALGVGEGVATAAAPEEYIRPSAEKKEQKAAVTQPSVPKPPKTMTASQRRRQTLVMSGIVVIVIAAAFVAFNLNTSSGGSTGPQLPPAAPYEHFSVTGEGDLTFNGSSPGPAMTVPNDTNVWVTFTVSSTSSVGHSWVLVPGNASHNVSQPQFTPVFPNATSPNPTTGSAPGATDQIVFKVTQPGHYLYICEVVGHFQAGMFGYFNVTAGNATNSTAIAAHSGAAGLQQGQARLSGPMSTYTTKPSVWLPAAENARAFLAANWLKNEGF